MKLTSLHDRSALITGACGGMGMACARLIGRTRRLVLTDIDGGQLQGFGGTLTAEGYDVAACVTGDLADEGLVHGLIEATRAAGPLGALVHTAALSPAFAGWERILQANVLATELLLDAVEPLLGPGACAVLVASISGHRAPADAEADAILASPRVPDLLQRMQPHLERLAPAGAAGLAVTAYGRSKRAVIRMVEARAPAWGAKGARIMSISPGTIWTPMGRREVEQGPRSAGVLAATPIARWGTPMDIASAAAFLVSEEAGFITGCDLRIDGGVTPAMGGVTF